MPRRDDLIWGLRWGLSAGVLYGLLSFARSRLGRSGAEVVSPVRFVGVFIVGAACAGLLLGILRVRLTSGLASFWAGMLIVLPVVVANQLLRGAHDGLILGVFSVAVTSIVTGGLGGLVAWISTRARDMG